jgi:hypothetical protein
MVYSAAPPVKENLRWKGSNRIYNFHHHYINEGAVDCVHYVTGRSFAFSGLLSVAMSMDWVLTAVTICSIKPEYAGQ